MRSEIWRVTVERVDLETGSNTLAVAVRAGSRASAPGDRPALWPAVRLGCQWRALELGTSFPNYGADRSRVSRPEPWASVVKCQEVACRHDEQGRVALKAGTNPASSAVI